MKYGLSDKQLDELVSFIRKYSEVEEAVLFGSRVIDTYKEASDVDIALKGKNVTASLAAKIKFNIEEETYLPFFFDFIAYPTITSEELKRHIRNKGIVIYRKGMGEWKEYKLGAVITSNVESINKDYPHNTIQYLDTGSITCGKVDSFQELLLDDAPSRAKRLVKHNDIVYSTVRPIQRHYGFITNPFPNLVVSTGFSVIETKTNLAEPLFIYFYLTSTDIIEILDVIADGSTSAYPSLKPSDIENLDISLPPLPEQKAIASVLSSLDDKIDLLHRQNKTLEAMAETLFRQWFTPPTPLKGEQDGVEKSPLGDLGAREDWEEGVLQDVISVKGGTTPSTKEPEYWDGDIYWTSPRDLSNHISVFQFDTERKITERGLAKIGSGLLPIGTVLMSSRAPIGYLAITEIPLAINQGYIAIICDKVVSNYFIYLWCKVNMEEIKNSGNGSVFQEIAKSVFKEISITIPSQSLLEDFDKTVAPFFSKIKTNQQQIRTLEKLRDTLLPKLMNGEVRVMQ